MPSKTALPTREEVEAQAADLAAQLDTFRQQDEVRAAEEGRTGRVRTAGRRRRLDC